MSSVERFREQMLAYPSDGQAAAELKELAMNTTALVPGTASRERLIEMHGGEQTQDGRPAAEWLGPGEAQRRVDRYNQRRRVVALGAAKSSPTVVQPTHRLRWDDGGFGIYGRDPAGGPGDGVPECVQRAREGSFLSISRIGDAVRTRVSDLLLAQQGPDAYVPLLRASARAAQASRSPGVFPRRTTGRTWCPDRPSSVELARADIVAGDPSHELGRMDVEVIGHFTKFTFPQARRRSTTPKAKIDKDILSRALHPGHWVRYLVENSSGCSGCAPTRFGACKLLRVPGDLRGAGGPWPEGRRGLPCHRPGPAAPGTCFSCYAFDVLWAMYEADIPDSGDARA